ncbi:MAG: hypothetical protein IT440_05425 [Phycisphaeraceae bacterium]|nr:hypothetical protein [Phycisphaeraceae bacterium]
MPVHVYRCLNDDHILSVRLCAAKPVGTWAQLCRMLALPPGDRPGETPIELLRTLPCDHHADHGSCGCRHDHDHDTHAAGETTHVSIS